MLLAYLFLTNKIIPANPQTKPKLKQNKAVF